MIRRSGSSGALVCHGGATKPRADAYPVWKLALVSLPMMFIAATFGVILPNSTPYLLRLGVPLSLATLNNLAGPITGFFTAPLVGAVSDSLTSRLGRRRPLILAGLASIWVSGALFAASGDVLPREAAAWFAAAMLWLLDIALNVLMFPVRALVSDLASGDQQVAVQALPICLLSVGSLMGFLFLELFEVPAEHMLELVLLCCSLLSVTVAVQFLVAEESPLPPETAGPEGARRTPVADVIAAVRGSSPLLRRVAAVHFLTWMGLTTWVFYAGQWFSTCVFQGDPRAPAGSGPRRSYVEGQAAFAHAGQTKSLVDLMASIAVLWVLQQGLVAPKLVYSASLFVGALVTAVTALFGARDPRLASICMSLVGLPWVASFSIPFGMIAEQSRMAEGSGAVASTALQMSLLNCGVTVAQQVMIGALSALELAVPVERALPAHMAVASAAFAAAGLAAALLDRPAPWWGGGPPPPEDRPPEGEGPEVPLRASGLGGVP